MQAQDATRKRSGNARERVEKMIALKIIMWIVFLIFVLLIYSCLKVASDCDDEEEKNDGA